jgi:hypothetical protein
MTAEETAQVNAYIQQVEAKHTVKLQLSNKARKLAQEDADKMRTAVTEIWKLSKTEVPPAEFGKCVRQIINYYAPDWDIPF